ncbi:MAG: CotH kinase family protein, partial [Ruminococcus flavefaciens]|nr:CotH kinase family protein [Ruminococcus flavefaciens]
MKKITKKICSIMLAISLAVSAMAGFQSGTVTVSAADESDESFQKLGGTYDHTDSDAKSMEYSINKENSEVDFDLKVIEDADVWIELRQGGNYITATTEAMMWTAPNVDDTQISVDKNEQGNFDKFKADTDYKIVVKRTENGNQTDYEIVIKEVTGNQETVCVTYKAENAVLTGNVSLYLIAISGKFEMRSSSKPDKTIQRLEEEGASSMEYSINEENSEITFVVNAITDANAWIELRQGEDYITASTTNKDVPGDIWTFPFETSNENGGSTSLSVEKGSGFGKFKANTEYKITVTRTDAENKTNYEIVIKEVTGDQETVCVTYKAEDAVLKGDVSLYLIAKGGGFEVRSASNPKPEFLQPQAQKHGTDRTKRYTMADVNNTPPADYTIPEGLVRDAKDKAYEKYFPKDSIQTVKVEMDEANLNYMLQHADRKPSVMTNSVTIGDTTLGYAGIKTKGNYTLASTNESDSDRFSFTLNFGKYIKKNPYGAKQNFYGCRKISFNNCFFDKTIMKEYNAMRLMDEMGLPTPQYSLAKLYINDEYYGVYFMVEAMDTAIIERYQNVSSKDVSDYLTKPSYTNMTYNFETELENCLNADKEFTLETLENAGLHYDAVSDYYSLDENSVLHRYNGLWEEDYDGTLQDVATMLPKVLTWNRKIQLLSDGKDFDKDSIEVNSDR